jgi:ribulose-phosphate 3-epimerase
MPTFIPAILDADPQIVQQQLHELDGLVDRIQIDFADLSLVENQTVLPAYCPVTSISAEVEAHLMVSHPIQYFPTLAKQGFKRVIVHIESAESAEEMRRQAKNNGLDLAIAINPETPVDHLPLDLEGIDYIQIMSIHPGFGGQPFLEETYDHVRAIKEYYEDVVIAVDGGVRLTNAQALIDAGVELLIVGRGGFALEGDVASGVEEWHAMMSLC